MTAAAFKGLSILHPENDRTGLQLADSLSNPQP